MSELLEAQRCCRAAHTAFSALFIIALVSPVARAQEAPTPEDEPEWESAESTPAPPQDPEAGLTSVPGPSAETALEGEATIAPEDVSTDASTIPTVAEPEHAAMPEEDAAPAAEPPWPGPITLRPPTFAENDRADGNPEDWTFTFHGYARMALRFKGAAQRPPYLVDDNYFLSGFAYTRVNESEWAEVNLGVQKDSSRFVVGLFASQFSDWSETTLQGQNGIATAFVEHRLQVGDSLELVGRAGMFWDRYGYVPDYDTYIFGRTHIAGLRLAAKLQDRYYLKLGFGAHSDVISSNQGFTPVALANAGVDLGWFDGGLYLLSTWTDDTEREFAIIEEGSLRVWGGEGRLAIPHVGELYAAMAHYKAEQVLYLANGLEVLHSTGGRGLTENFFGFDSENGTGEAIVGTYNLRWEPARSLAALADASAGRTLKGLELKLFSLLAWIRSKQRSEDPLENRDHRIYFKWGTEAFYRPPRFPWFFGSVRYDRVILDTDHESMSFRLITPRVGITPVEGLDVWASYSHYWYGDNVFLRPNQIPGDVSARDPDKNVFKLQAQVRW
jgi:hypothetical protein